MALLVFAGDKGAPGVTTAAVVLGAVWPRKVLVVECDAAGADIAYRYRGHDKTRLGQDRGVVSLATTIRADTTPAQAWNHAQLLDGGLPVLLGPVSAAQVAAVGWSWAPLAALLAGVTDGDVVVDCGRLTGNLPALEFVSRADAVVMFVRPSVDGVAHLVSGLRALVQSLAAHFLTTPASVQASTLAAAHTSALASGPAQAGMSARKPYVGVVVVAEKTSATDDVRQVADALIAAGVPVPVLGWLGFDPPAVAGLRGEWTRKLDRSTLVSTARDLASAIDAHLVDQLGVHPPDTQLPDSADLPDLLGLAEDPANANAVGVGVGAGGVR